MSSVTSYKGQDHHVQLYCSRTAQHTYEVCVARATDPENQDFSVVDIWPDTTDIQLKSEEEPSWLVKRVNKSPERRPSAVAKKPRSLLNVNKEDAAQPTQDKPSHESPRPSFYYDASRGQYRTAEGQDNIPEDAGQPPPYTATLKTARQRLIEILKTDEFFDEYSFMALMALLLAHMFRLCAAVFVMGCNAPTIIDVFICVWRFMHNKVDDIMLTDGGSLVGCKCLIFSAELLVIFICIFIFLWTVFIPVCNSLTAIISKILSLIT